MKRVGITISASALVLVAVAACGAFGESSEGTASNGGDAAADTGTGSADAGGGFCATHATDATVFCDDFDVDGRTKVEPGGWSAITPFPTGEVTTERAASPAQAARFACDGGRAGAKRSIPFPSAATRLTVRAKVQPSAPYAPEGRLLVLFFGDCEIDHFASDGIRAYCKGSTDQPTLSTPTVPPGEFTSVALAVERAPGGLHVFVETGEGPNTVKNDALLTLPTTNTTTVDVAIGNVSADIVGTAWIDDVLVDVR